MSKKIHMCLSIKGALMNWSLEQFEGILIDDDGKEMSARECKRKMIDMLGEGHWVLPMGKCDNFDIKTGCRGHEEPDKE